MTGIGAQTPETNYYRYHQFHKVMNRKFSNLWSSEKSQTFSKIKSEHFYTD